MVASLASSGCLGTNVRHGPLFTTSRTGAAGVVTIRQPQTAAFGLLLGDLQSLTPPDPLDPLVVDDPAYLIPQHPRNLEITIAAILSGQRDDVGGQPLLVFKAPRYLALRRAMLAERRTSAALGYVKLTLHMLDASTAARRA